MIIFFTGTPGSGKTYEAVKKILDNLRNGRTVYTNIDGMDDPICQETIKNFLGMDDCDFSERFVHLGSDKYVIENFWDHCNHGSLIVLDEVQKFFGNRDWQTDKNKSFANWASTHRHEGYDLVIITQSAERVDAAVRALVEWNYVFRKINFFGGAVQKKYLCYAYAGDATSGPPLTKSVRHYNAKVFKCYKSYVTNDTKELSIMKHVNVLKHPVFFAIPLVLCFCLYMLFFKSSLGKGDFLGVDTIQNEAFASVGSREETSPTKSTLDKSILPSPQVIDPQVIAAPEEIETKQIKLNYVQIFRKHKISYKILFDGRIYGLRDFPYPIEINQGELYSDIPLDVLETDES